MKFDIFFLLIFKFFTTSHAADFRCDSLFALAESQHNERYLLGLLAELENKKIILALDDYYFGEHKAMYDKLNSISKIKSILWAGEIEFDETQNQVLIRETVNTSGYVQYLIRQGVPEVQNDPLRLKAALMQYKPQWINESTQFRTFSDVYPHVDPTYRQLFSQCKENCRGDTVRHMLRNSFSSILIGFGVESLPESQRMQVARQTVSPESWHYFSIILNSWKKSARSLPDNSIDLNFPQLEDIFAADRALLEHVLQSVQKIRPYFHHYDSGLEFIELN